jgi:hypothetical protein
MDCNKGKYFIHDILKKVEAGKQLEHCEELYCLKVHHQMSEEEAERFIYQGGVKPKEVGKSKRG